ncbi:MAG: zf-HC2 domain-containing protein [Candidatus Binatia bacterium]
MVYRDDASRRVCKDLEQGLVLYYYGECVEAERRSIETHLEGCASCRYFLESLRTLLPLTVKPDDPPQAFWESYSREMHRKLEAVEERVAWWRDLFSLARPWPVPALATASVLVLALTLTFTKGLWHRQDFPPEGEAILEILPMAENLEFFKTMELLDAMGLIEAVAGPGNSSA